MGTPDEIGATCAEPECPGPDVIAGWCPGHALQRYRREAVRPTPARYLSYRSRQALEDEKQS